MKNIMNIIRGFIIWVGNVIPGLSGGSMAFILGIYDKLISSPTDFIKQNKDRGKILMFWGMLFVGGVVGVVLFSHIMNTYLQSYDLKIRVFFVGLLVGCLPAIYLSIDKKKASNYSILAFGLGVLVMLPFLFIEVGGGELLEVESYRQVLGFINMKL